MLFSDIDSLVVEASRRCDSRCPHCLRGEPQDLDISEKVLDAFLAGCTDDLSISTLNIGGGEPVLVVPQISLIRKKLLAHGASYQGFYLVTGGNASMDQIQALAQEALDLWCFAEDKDINLSGLALSKDRFHPGTDYRVRFFLSGLSFFRPDDKAHNDGRVQYLIREGRAASLPENNGYILRDLSWTDFTFDEVRLETFGNQKHIYASGGELYLCANGNIVNCCDLSYEHADREPICSVFDADWPAKWFAATRAAMDERN